MVLPVWIEQIVFQSGCSAAEIGKISIVFRSLNFNQVAFSLTQGSWNFQPSTSTFQIFVQVCLPLAFDELETHVNSKTKNPFSTQVLIMGLWNLVLPPTVAGLFSLYQAPTDCEGFVSSLIFPNARFLLGRVRDSRAFQKYCISNRVAPVSVNSSISLGFPTPNREAECRVRKGVGL